MSILSIVAVDLNGAIGKGGSVPWHYSADMKFFKQQTTGHACLMGYRTWLSLKRPLPGRLNLVLSRTSEARPQPSVLTLRDKPAALALIPYLSCDLYIIGGAQIYRTFADVIDQWLVTVIPIKVEGADTFMPHDFLQGFAQTSTLELEDNLTVQIHERNQAQLI